MATSEPESESAVSLTAGGWSGDVVGGLLASLLGVIHLFGLQLGGGIGFVLLLVGWPLVGGAVGARVERSRSGGRDWGTTSGLAGTFGALVVSLIVFLSGLSGVWSGFITTAFGNTFWPVVFAVLVVFTVSWTVFGYVGGYIEAQLAGDAGSPE